MRFFLTFTSEINRPLPLFTPKIRPLAPAAPSTPTPKRVSQSRTLKRANRRQVQGRASGGGLQDRGQTRQAAGDQQRRRRRHRGSPGSVGHVAQRRLAARLTRVDLDPLADHDAPVLALARAVPLQRPQLRPGRGVLVARRVRVPLHLRKL